jgi:hypothetical protein
VNSHEGATEESTMHPTIQHDIMQARVAGLRRQAERDRLAPAVSRDRRIRRERRRRPVPAATPSVLARRLLAALGGRSL